MALGIGKLVRYKSLPDCVGFILEVGSTMIKVKWSEGDVVEWIPFYAVEIIDV